MDFSKESLTHDIVSFFESTTGIATIVVCGLLYVFAWCRLFSKAGFHGGLGLLTIIPPLAIIMPLWLAFVTWPVDREVRGLKRMQKAVTKAEKLHSKFSKAS